MVEKGKKKATEEIKDTPEMINRKKEDVRRRRRRGRRGGGGVMEVTFQVAALRLK